MPLSQLLQSVTLNLVKVLLPPSEPIRADLSNWKQMFNLPPDLPTDVIKQANELGFDFRSWIEAGKIKFIYLNLDDSSIYKEMEQEIKSDVAGEVKDIFIKEGNSVACGDLIMQIL
jgi:hypothetical protein